MNKNLLIFGVGDFAQQMKYYFEEYSDYKITAFVIDKSFITCNELNGIKIISFEEVLEKFPPSDFDFFVATGYSQMNNLRSKKIKEIKKMGYFIPNFIHPTAFLDKTIQIGQNCVILEKSIIQPNVILKDGVIIWASSIICHNSIIKDCSFIASQVCINGFVEVGSQCFLGANSTIRDKIKIGDYSLIGAGCTITKNTEKNSVYKFLPPNKIEINSFYINI